MDPFNEIEDIKTLETIANDYQTLDKLKKELTDKERQEQQQRDLKLAMQLKIEKEKQKQIELQNKLLKEELERVKYDK